MFPIYIFFPFSFANTITSANHYIANVFKETTITEIKQKIMKIPDANGIVIDGFPRDIGQALSFEDQVCFSEFVFKHTTCMFMFTNKLFFSAKVFLCG